MSDNDQNLNCSFCGKGRKDVTKMVVGESKVCICNECIQLCNEILFEDANKLKVDAIKNN